MPKNKCVDCQQQFVCTSEDGNCSTGTIEFLHLEEEMPVEWDDEVREE